jgi:NaMN:DMB phosphoribosyltransferase
MSGRRVRLERLRVLVRPAGPTVSPERQRLIAAWLARETGQTVEAVVEMVAVRAEQLAREPLPPLPLDATREQVIALVAEREGVPVEEVRRWADALDRL